MGSQSPQVGGIYQVRAQDPDNPLATPLRGNAPTINLGKVKGV